MTVVDVSMIVYIFTSRPTLLQFPMHSIGPSDSFTSKTILICTLKFPSFLTTSLNHLSCITVKRIYIQSNV